MKDKQIEINELREIEELINYFQGLNDGDLHKIGITAMDCENNPHEVLIKLRKYKVEFDNKKKDQIEKLF